MYPTMPLNTPYTGRHRVQLRYVRQNGHVCAARRAFPIIPNFFCVLALALCAVLFLNHPAYAADLTDTEADDLASATIVTDAVANPAPQPTAPKTLALSTAPDLTTLSATPAPLSQHNPDATYIYLDCPVMGFRGTAYENEPIECLVDEFENLPERWLYVLTPLDAGESYFFTLDLACRTLNAPFEGQITAVYNSHVTDDGSLGTVTIEATEEVAPNTFLVYHGELKYISDGTVNLVPNSYGSIYDYHLFYFSLTTTDVDYPAGTEPLGEQRLSRISGPSVSAEVAIIGNAQCTENVYDNDLLQSDYMYPYRKYEPAEGSQPNDVPSETVASNAPDPATELAVRLAEIVTGDDYLSELADTVVNIAALDAAAPGPKPVEPSTLSEPIFFLARYLATPDLAHPAAI